MGELCGWATFCITPRGGGILFPFDLSFPDNYSEVCNCSALFSWLIYNSVVMWKAFGISADISYFVIIVCWNILWWWWHCEELASQWQVWASRLIFWINIKSQQACDIVKTKISKSWFCAMASHKRWPSLEVLSKNDPVVWPFNLGVLSKNDPVVWPFNLSLHGGYKSYW